METSFQENGPIILNSKFCHLMLKGIKCGNLVSKLITFSKPHPQAENAIMVVE